MSWHSSIRTWLGEADRAENFAEFVRGEADFVNDLDMGIAMARELAKLN
jgi:hypothetical protein